MNKRTQTYLTRIEAKVAELGAIFIAHEAIPTGTNATMRYAYMEKYGRVFRQECSAMLSRGNTPWRTPSYPVNRHTPILYRFRNEAGEVVYVGQTNDVTTRFTQHFGDSINCFKAKQDVHYIEMVETENEAMMFFLESYLINSIKPKHNTLSKGEGTLSITLDPNLLWIPIWHPTLIKETL